MREGQKVNVRDRLSEKSWCISDREGKKVVYLREGGGVSGMYLREGGSEKMCMLGMEGGRKDGVSQGGRE